MNWLSYLRIYAVGLCMGVADLIPGVSGGTIAFICGVYDRLIDGIKSFDLELLRRVLRRDFAGAWAKIPFFFLAALGLGIVTSILTLSKVLASLFTTHPVELWSFFFGLILASILLLARETWRWSVGDFGVFLVATAATYVLVGLPVMRTPDSLPFLFLSGAVAISAMILPGISGSYILVILGKYHEVLAALNDRDFVRIGTFVLGIAVGVVTFVRIVSWLLHHYRKTTLVALTGVMAGALRTVWPWKEVVSTRLNSKGVEVPLEQANILPPLDGSVAIAVACAVAGCLAVLVISRLGREKSASARRV
jgi:putative membrane protein